MSPADFRIVRACFRCNS